MAEPHHYLLFIVKIVHVVQKRKKNCTNCSLRKHKNVALKSKLKSLTCKTPRLHNQFKSCQCTTIIK